MRRALALVAAVALTACSGSGSAASSTTTGPAKTTTTTAPVFSGDAQSPFCTSDALRNGAPNPFADPNATPDQLRAKFVEMKATLATLVPLAPKELAADMATVQQGLEVLGSYLERYGFDLQRAAAEGTDAERAMFNDRRFAAAGVRFRAYLKQVCKIVR